MSDFFRKLNVLVKAGLSDLLDSQGGERQGRPAPGILGTDVDRDIHTLRQRVDEALQYENDLDARVQTLRAEVDRLDQEADAAVAQGQDDAARRAVEQLQRGQQRLAMAESDLHEHQIVTQELMTRVRELETAVAEARKAQPAGESQAGDSLERASQMVAEVLREMRERIAELSEMIGTPAIPEASEEASERAADEAAIDDDLARRRERLSKK